VEKWITVEMPDSRGPETSPVSRPSYVVADEADLPAQLGVRDTPRGFIEVMATAA
jgi:hypothetical protein